MALANDYVENANDVSKTARWAYEIADAMLAERAKGETVSEGTPK